MALLIRIFFCIFLFGFFLYLFIDHQNDLTQLRKELPLAERELQRVEEDNMALQYNIEQFESPQHLLELAQLPEFQHLHYPYADDVKVVSGE